MRFIANIADVRSQNPQYVILSASSINYLSESNSLSQIKEGLVIHDLQKMRYKIEINNLKILAVEGEDNNEKEFEDLFIQLNLHHYPKSWSSILILDVRETIIIDSSQTIIRS